MTTHRTLHLNYRCHSFTFIRATLVALLLIGVVHIAIADAGSASIQPSSEASETDGKTYIANVLQPDGSRRVVRYTKKASGIIIPPETNDGKLLDGTPATDNPNLNRGKNRSILSRYDKESQILYALVNKRDIIGNADKKLKTLINLAETNSPISKEKIYDGFFGAYIYGNGGKELAPMINGIETVARVKVGMTNQEIETIKLKAQKAARDTWVEVTGALD